MKKRVICKAAALLFAAVLLFSGCSLPKIVSVEPEIPGPEVGCWSGEYLLSEISRDSLSSIAGKILSTVAGDTSFDVEMEFTRDGYFYYDVNLEKMKESLSGPLNAVVGIFVDVDLSAVMENLLASAFRKTLKSCEGNYSGTYASEGEMLICDCGEQEMRFLVRGSRIIQLNEDGTDFMTFKPSA